MRYVSMMCMLALGACEDEGGTNTTDTTVAETDVSVTETSNPTDTADAIDPGECSTPGGAGPRFDQPASRFVAGVYSTHRALNGQVWAGAPPVPHVEAERSGQCRLLRYTPSFCDPACEFGEPCIDGACVAWPGTASAGTITLTGIAPAPVTVEPSEGTYWWQAEDTFATTSVGLSAEGDVVPAFALEACVPAMIEPATDWSAQLEARDDGEDVTLAWADPVPGARFTIRMTTGIGTHGGISPVEIECEGPDEGTLTLPGSYLDALYAEGWSCGECGGNYLYRYFADEADAGGTTVQLRVQTSADFWFRP